MRIRTLASTTLALLVSGYRLPAQGTLAQRIAAVQNGSVTFQFAARPGICGDGENYVRMGHRTTFGRISSRMTMLDCVRGPVQVQVLRLGGETTRVESWVGMPRRRGDARDLGTVSAREGATYLLDLATHARGRAAEKSVLPAVLADSMIVWPSLLTIAKDRDGRGKHARGEAIFWLARFAHAKLLGRPEDLAADEGDHGADDESDLKSHAVFVLSQLPPDQGVPQLLQVARTHKDPHVRGKALFWLGQSGDERVLSLFEQILK